MEFKYLANNSNTGEQMNGTAFAADVSDLVLRLKSDGLIPLKVYETKSSNSKKGTIKRIFQRPIKSKELAVFTRQLAATLSAGLLLSEALETIADDLENTYFSKIISRIKEDIHAGSDFSTALAKYPKIFSVTYISIVKSGEASGSLHITMKNLAEYLENSQRIKEKVKNAIRYPTFVIGFAFLVVTVIVLFLIPKFQGMFANAGAELPLLTRIVVGVSEFALNYSPVFFITAIASWFLYLNLLRFKRFKYLVDAIKLKIPILGKDIIHKSLISRFCRTLGFLLASGVGLSKSLEISSQAVDHQLMGQAIEQIRMRVISGASLADEIRKQPIFPRLAAKMAAVGEKTGKISEMLTRTSDYYDEELDSSLQKLTTLLEPALIVFVGGIILLVVLALYLPIFQMSTAIR